MALWREPVLLMLMLIMVPSCTGDVGYFWHVSDFHYDWSYHDLLWSCKTGKRPTNPGPMGSFWCDSPWLLVESSCNAMKTIKPDVDFVLWTGDSILHHYGPEVTYDLNDATITNLTNILKETFPGLPVYATYGNHDYLPSDQFPAYNNRLYNDTLEIWKDWINDPSQHDNFRKGGYYTVKTQWGLRIVALNDNLWYKANKQVANYTDPADHLAWLRQILHHAELNKEKVLLTAHIPPGIHAPRGKRWIVELYNGHLVQILERYANLIVGMHFGHEHVEGFRVLFNNQSKPASVVFAAPSVTPFYNDAGFHNPAVRLVKYDRQTGKHLEIDQYYLDLDKANVDTSRAWELEYNSRVDYNLPDVTAESMWNLVQRMANRNSKEFQNYWKFVTVLHETLKMPCDTDECHVKVLCGFEHFTMKKYEDCIDERMKIINGIAGAPREGASVVLVGMLSILLSFIF